MIVFLGKRLSAYQIDEVNAAYNISHRDQGQPRSFLFVQLPTRPDWPSELELLSTYPRLRLNTLEADSPRQVCDFAISSLEKERATADGLPRDPHMFRYEKDIIAYFTRRLFSDGALSLSGQTVATESGKGSKWLDGCPDKWPEVTLLTDESNRRLPTRYLQEEDVGKWRPKSARVVAAALTGYHTGNNQDSTILSTCMIQHGLCFPEAGPREVQFYPDPRDVGLRVAILVSGGIAPGINAVIDGIVQRHYLYADPARYADSVRYHDTPRCSLEIRGLLNGFRAFDDPNDPFTFRHLIPNQVSTLTHLDIVTSEHANQGGSMLGTSRVDELISEKERMDRLESMVDKLLSANTDILYVIGGDGSMKAAHSIWSIAKAWRRPNSRLLSVVAIPKTMDNDILWVWQSFGFLSAVEKAREVIKHLSTEVTSNPRLCIVQLFGSDSGFVVSHAVLASQTGQCDVALVPEVDFSMEALSRYLKERIYLRRERIPRALIIMAETAVPTDALDFVDDAEIALNVHEKEAIRAFERLRASGKRIQGQTDDALRSAGLKIVSIGLRKMIPVAQIDGIDDFKVTWSDMRVVVNEPRHLLRAISPSCSDIIMGSRLGTLAVDNAMAGYTDFMVSQWLTEYVLVPLQMVVMGRKRIPDSGIFWKSVRAKTGQPADLTGAKRTAADGVPDLTGSRKRS